MVLCFQLGWPVSSWGVRNRHVLLVSHLTGRAAYQLRKGVQMEVDPLSLVMRAFIHVDSVTQWLVAIPIGGDDVLSGR
jgi:hypothetical protein